MGPASACTLRVLDGMIFVNFAEDPPDFSALEREMGPRAAPVRPRQGEGRAAPQLPDHEQLEARGRELLRVLSLPARAPGIFRRPRPRDPGRGMRRDALGRDGQGGRRRPHAAHDPPLLARRAGLRPGLRLRPLPAAARPAHRAAATASPSRRCSARSRATTAARPTGTSGRSRSRSPTATTSWCTASRRAACATPTARSPGS